MRAISNNCQCAFRDCLKDGECTHYARPEGIWKCLDSKGFPYWCPLPETLGWIVFMIDRPGTWPRIGDIIIMFQDNLEYLCEVISLPNNQVSDLTYVSCMTVHDIGIKPKVWHMRNGQKYLTIRKHATERL